MPSEPEATEIAPNPETHRTGLAAPAVQVQTLRECSVCQEADRAFKAACEVPGQFEMEDDALQFKLRQWEDLHHAALAALRAENQRLRDLGDEFSNSFEAKDPGRSYWKKKLRRALAESSKGGA